MYPVGVLFGLGFDTATEVALLAAAGAAAVGGLHFYAILPADPVCGGGDRAIRAIAAGGCRRLAGSCSRCCSLPTAPSRPKRARRVWADGYRRWKPVRCIGPAEELGVVHHAPHRRRAGAHALERSTLQEHLACECCGCVETVDAGRLHPARDAIRQATGFRARFSHPPIVGWCGECASYTRE